jgi:hypothetical protein
MESEIVDQGIELEVDNFSPLFLSIDFLIENGIVENINQVDFSQLQISNIGAHIKLVDGSKIIADWTSIQIESENVDIIVKVFKVIQSQLPKIRIKGIIYKLTVHLLESGILEKFNSKLIKIDQFELRQIVFKHESFFVGFHECKKDRLHLAITDNISFDKTEISEINKDLYSIHSSVIDVLNKFLKEKLELNEISF